MQCPHHAELKLGRRDTVDHRSILADECEHHRDGGCEIAGKEAGVDHVPVTAEQCKFCAKNERPGPKQLNSVTAGVALQWMSTHDPGRLRASRKRLYGFLECAQATRRCSQPDEAESPPRSMLLLAGVSPGDICTMTAAVYSLHQAYPGRFHTAVNTTAMEIWEHNPHVNPIEQDARHIDMHYPEINRSNQASISFLAGYTQYLAAQLKLPIPLATNRPMLYLSDDERSWISQVDEITGGGVPYWIVNAGVKSDYTAKQWPVEYYQDVITKTRGRIVWVQIGAREHDHPELDGVLDLRDKTDHRQLIRLVYHAQGGLGPVTYIQHLCAAWEKPYICLLGGREPVPWVQYPLQHTLHTMGLLDCCRHAACWRSRVVALSDGDQKNESLCEHPWTDGIRPAAGCMHAIKPDTVLQILARILDTSER